MCCKHVLGLHNKFHGHIRGNFYNALLRFVYLNNNNLALALAQQTHSTTFNVCLNWISMVAPLCW